MTMLRTFFALLVCSLASLPAQITETIGGTASSPSGVNRGKASLFAVDSSVLLLDFEMHLNVPGPDTLTFFAYRHHSRTGTAQLVWTHPVAVTGGGGAQWYSSGPIAQSLVAGNHYALGVYWSGNVQYFYQTAAAGTPLSFGTWQRAHTVTGSIPATISFTGSDIAQYYQRLTTVPFPSVVNTGTGCASTALTPRLVANDFFFLNTTPSLELVDAAPSSIAVFGLAFGPALPVSIPIFNCGIWLDISGPVITLTSLTSATGTASLPITVPNDPALLGLTLTAQDLVFTAASIDVSNAVTFTIS